MSKTKRHLEELEDGIRSDAEDLADHVRRFAEGLLNDKVHEQFWATPLTSVNLVALDEVRNKMSYMQDILLEIEDIMQEMLGLDDNICAYRW